MNASSVLRRHPLSLALILLALALLLAGCDVVPRPMPTAIPVVQPTAQPGLPNPASVYCQEQGGRLEIRTDADGGQAGYCVFPYGSECEEWAFLHGECSHSVVPTTVPPNPDTTTEARIATERTAFPHRRDPFAGRLAVPAQPLPNRRRREGLRHLPVIRRGEESLRIGRRRS